jgi:hypothetical protein
MNNLLSRQEKSPELTTESLEVLLVYERERLYQDSRRAFPFTLNERSITGRMVIFVEVKSRFRKRQE